MPLDAFLAEVREEVAARGLPETCAGGPGTGRGGVTLEHLWAGWRREYIVEATERERAGGVLG